jgi:DNA (cytosine-5)-methyltransferase 1
LIKYYGEGIGQTMDRPLDTITTKDRFGLVTVLIGNEQYVIKDIFLRMLKPSELKIMQGFPEDYIIDRDIDWKPYPLKEQVARIGNSVVPIMAQVLVQANCPYLIKGKRAKNLVIDSSGEQCKFAI